MVGRRMREIVYIDEEKCDGCGVCIPSCHEGAIQIIDGKARLVADRLCDGLGDCLGVCPRGAIRVERREAEEFDAAAVRARQAPQATPAACACPGALAQRLPAADSPMPEARVNPSGASQSAASRLGHWPVQLHLLPVHSELWENADVLIAADCVGFSLPDLHSRLLAGRTVAIGCPKLDALEVYVEKLTAILRNHEIRSLTVAHMEVPCCTGLATAVREALTAAGRNDLEVEDLTVTCDGRIRERPAANVPRESPGVGRTACGFTGKI
ncbi:MAG: 4Fe-4S binding protein [Candidatus Eisenbacteria sp.]|nr:4Fe-4S binding protein [Candidatus Eisenbacteria bacterium]